MICISIFLHFLAYAAGEFTVLSHPSGITFKGHDRVRESLLKEVYSAALGFTTEEDSNWQGMYLSDPFNLAEAAVLVYVDGVSDIELVKGHHFPLSTDADEGTFSSLRKRISERYGFDDSNIVHVDLADGLESVSDNNVYAYVTVNLIKWLCDFCVNSICCILLIILLI